MSASPLEMRISQPHLGLLSGKLGGAALESVLTSLEWFSWTIMLGNSCSQQCLGRELLLKPKLQFTKTCDPLISYATSRSYTLPLTTRHTRGSWDFNLYWLPCERSWVNLEIYYFKLVWGDILNSLIQRLLVLKQVGKITLNAQTIMCGKYIAVLPYK